MQYSFTLDFTLRGKPTDELMHFVSPEGANVVLATQTMGGNILPKPTNIYHLEVHIPGLKKRAFFPVLDEPHKIRLNMAIYNFVCSLNSYTLVHFIEPEENKFFIQMTTDKKRDYELIKSVAQHFDED